MSDAWFWPIAPLVGGIFAVWLLTFAVTYAWVLSDGDRARGRVIALTALISGLGLCLVP
jgi:hypothetical protein